MATDDDDILDPDAEPTAAERAHAKAFAELLDKTLAGRALPPAMAADDRALLEVATVIRAASGGLELAASKQHSVIEDALRQAVGGTAAASLSTTPITSARRKRWAPWAVAGVSTLIAAAAILMLWLRTPADHVTHDQPVSWMSRPSDPLIGPIPQRRELAAAAIDASDRIDYIFADRLEGYRERRLSSPGGKP